MNFKRGRKADTEFSERMHWLSRCGCYRIAHTQCKFSDVAHFSAEKKLPATGLWWPIEWHHNRKRIHTFRKYRTKAAAEKICSQHHQEGK